ncbi:S-adenosyl-L-methionine-dependent methyltransferase [Aspergillus sclerotioniger CBS 115572]|uniref:S-adenosyl-L-methionine-dependent methyltransferase n=1 Tax=Aspergillus sclerotioniger CBS 115572 TaxID=1450535 RepID=A0A317VBP4_9EURO|nr:S-adenosyl-L-methionine-dependent methyltransferase [Aspergillus sclerotioniger CBS 115572]PWY71774.1 S-adenosyl-L-methionine-dependent methyltransferase [Aspergillus sclerotioniger CBS 115572]
MTTFPLEELSWTITKNASIVSQYLAAHQLPQPSVHGDGPSTVVPSKAPPAIQQARQHLMAASLELLQLAIGPSEYLPNLAMGFQYTATLHYLLQFNIFHLVPLPPAAAISYTDLSTMSGIPEPRLKSILRMAMTNSLFLELPDTQHVTHSATSAFLSRNPDAHTYASYMCAKSAPMALDMAAAHQKWGAGTTSLSETAYNVAFDTDMPFFEHIGQDEARMNQFARYMRNVRSSEGVDINHLVNGYPWGRIPDQAVVVDVGGSTGTSSLALAESYPHLHFIVQDLPANTETGKQMAQTLTSELSARLTFQAHDFTKPQPVRGADVYLLRMILHDWPDREAARILGNIASAMEDKKSTSRLVIMDTVLPTPGSAPVSVERIVRARDLTMMQAFNSKERELDDWRDLLTAADARFRIVGVEQPVGSAMSVLEVALSCYSEQGEDLQPAVAVVGIEQC